MLTTISKSLEKKCDICVATAIRVLGLFLTNRDFNDKFRALPRRGIALQVATMLFGHNLVADRQAQPGPFANRLCRKEGIKESRSHRLKIPLRSSEVKRRQKIGSEVVPKERRFNKVEFFL